MVHFVLMGRLEATLYDRLGKPISHDMFTRGAVVGLFSVMTAGPSRLHVTAVENTTVFSLDLADLLRLATKNSEFQLAMFRAAANVVGRLVSVDRDLPKPATVAILHQSPASRPLTIQLVRRLKQIGECPCVASDDERWNGSDDVPFRLLFEHEQPVSQEYVERTLVDWRANNRLFIDLMSSRPAGYVERVLKYSDAVLWCVRPQDLSSALPMLQNATRAVPGLADKLCLVWQLNHEEPVALYLDPMLQKCAREFKIYTDPLGAKQGSLLGHGIERIIHFLRGISIGLALGGGAARGMAHLGVLNALEKHGIYVDVLAGTSAGAMVGGVYAAGMSPTYATSCFKNDLLPSRLFRWLPAGGYWYLLYQYRSGLFESMLRKYLGHMRMEQLLIPVRTVCVDLVEGAALIRSTGDATRSILESINLPPLAIPLFDSESAIVDGGLLNNVPANVLNAEGCNFVIASTVSATLEKDFLGIRSKRRLGLRKYTTTLQVMMRQNMIQSKSMNAVGVQPADFVIAPDVTAFDLSEFTRADEMAIIGEETTNASIEQLKEMLSRLDPQLFPNTRC
jgi:NTE family protein